MVSSVIRILLLAWFVASELGIAAASLQLVVMHQIPWVMEPGKFVQSQRKARLLVFPSGWHICLAHFKF
jgi:hypothetical protein